MKRFKKYVFFGSVFSVALVAVAITSIGTTTNAGTTVFLSQTDTSKTSAAELGQYQQLDCGTLPYDIVQAELALSGPTQTTGQDVQLVLGRIDGKGTWDKLKKREVGRSNTVRFSSEELEVVTFTFDPPIQSDVLCPNTGDMAYLRLEGVNAPGMYIHGSLKDAYAGPLYNCVLDSGLPCTGTIIDMAFSLLTFPNNPPVIEYIPDKEVLEMTKLTFTARATDPDGDTVTWSSSNLPEGAVLDSVTGVFTWTPTSDQVQDYKITIVATDDGGPVQESSSITVFVSVVDTVTLPELNELIIDTVLSLELETSIENSYLANLKNVEVFLEKGQFMAAENQLNVFIKKVEGDLQKENITQEQYNVLVEKANEMIAEIPSES